MCLFRKPETPQYGKVIAITVGVTLAVAAAAYAAYRFFAERCCKYCCDDCDCDCDCDCDDDDLFCDEDDDADDVEVEVEDAPAADEAAENA